MCYAIAWGTPVLTGPTFVPPAVGTQGWAYGNGWLRLVVGPGIAPIPVGVTTLIHTGSIEITAPFQVAGPTPMLRARLSGLTMGGFTRNASSGRVSTTYVLLPSGHVVDGSVEIRTGGRMVYRIPPLTLSDRRALWLQTSANVSRRGSNDDCTLTIGVQYELVMRLMVRTKLRVIGLRRNLDSASAMTDFMLLMTTPAGLTVQIALPLCAHAHGIELPPSSGQPPGVIPGGGFQPFEPPNLPP